VLTNPAFVQVPCFGDRNGITAHRKHRVVERVVQSQQRCVAARAARRVRQSCRVCDVE
jgi:hypothetical protein